MFHSFFGSVTSSMNWYLSNNPPNRIGDKVVLMWEPLTNRDSCAADAKEFLIPEVFSYWCTSGAKQWTYLNWIKYCLQELPARSRLFKLITPTRRKRQTGAYYEFMFCITKSLKIWCVSFSISDSDLWLYHLLEWSNFHILHNLQWIRSAFMEINYFNSIIYDIICYLFII